MTCLTVWVLTNGRRGDIVQCEAIARGLSDDIQFKTVNPKPPFSWIMPYGPPDPRDHVVLEAPAPDLIIASGRRTVPYVKALQRKNRECKAVFMKYPGCDVSSFALSWHPEHDKRRGETIIESLTSPHTLTARMNARVSETPALEIPDWLQALPSPRLALLLGGNSKAVTYTPDTIARFIEALGPLDAFGSVMVSGSRRTPPALLEAVRSHLPLPSYVWDFTGDNPYLTFLTNADALLITGDSHNMVSEALAAGKKTYVFAPPDIPDKFNWTLKRLQEKDLICLEWQHMTSGSQAVYDETPNIIAEIKQKFGL